MLRDEWHERVFKNLKSKCNCLCPRGRDIQHITCWGKRMTQLFV